MLGTPCLVPMLGGIADDATPVCERFRDSISPHSTVAVGQGAGDGGREGGRGTGEKEGRGDC